jgi:hypothetical protein
MSPALLRSSAGAPLQLVRGLGLLALALGAAHLGCDGPRWVLGEPLTTPDVGSDAGPDAASTPACDDIAPASTMDAGPTSELTTDQIGHFISSVVGQEASAFPGDQVSLDLDANSGHLRFVSGAALPALEDGSGGYLCGAAGPNTCSREAGFVASFDYTLQGLSARGSILSFRLELDQPWAAWCELQKPVLVLRAGCAPGYAVEADYGDAEFGDTCRITRDGVVESIDCVRLSTLERGPCACDERQCTASPRRSLLVNLRQVSPDRLDGALWFDTARALVVHFERAPAEP